MIAAQSAGFRSVVSANGSAIGRLRAAGSDGRSRTLGVVRVVSQHVEDDHGLVEWATGEPAPVLAGLVRSYTGYREEGATPVYRRETPAGQYTLIVSFGDGFRAEGGGEAGELSDYTSFVAGMHDRPARTAHDGRQFGVQIRLDPLAAFSLLGVPLHELGNRVVELSDLLGADAERWTGQLSSVATWQGRFALLDGLLSDRMATGPVPSPGVVWAWRVMRRAGGAVRVTDLAEGAGCSHRHLAAMFRGQIGLTPKTAARVLRFERATRLLARGDTPAQVAATCGYADQPHLTREFVRLAGTTPGAGSPPSR
jgi:AraC-like DNA-binding protein